MGYMKISRSDLEKEPIKVAFCEDCGEIDTEWRYGEPLPVCWDWTPKANCPICVAQAIVANAHDDFILLEDE